MGRQPVCPLCGKPVAAKWRHIVVTVRNGRPSEPVVRHTQPCPKPAWPAGGLPHGEHPYGYGYEEE